MRRIRTVVDEAMHYLRWFYLYLKGKNKKLLQMYNNEDKKIVAIGNGPSAACFPYEKFKATGYEFLCVNFFALDEEKFFRIKPSYYCCIDSAFVTSKSELSGTQLKLVEVLERVDWDMTFVCLASTKLPLNNEYIRFHYINTFELKGELTKAKRKMYSSNKATHGYQNVMLAALYYLTMSKTKEVVLTGVENDWHRELSVDINNNVYRETTHFYGNNKLNITQIGEIGLGELYKYFYYYYITLYNYTLNAKYAEKEGTLVLNSCTKSYIDVYEKIDVGEVQE